MAEGVGVGSTQPADRAEEPADRRVDPPADRRVDRRAGRWLGATAIGLVVGVAGTMLHRSAPPWGMAVCLALVLSATVLVRAWAGLLPVVAYALAWLAVVQAMSLTGPGGDVLVPAGDSLGYVWGLGGMVVIGVACFLPSRWFRDAPAHAA